MLALAVPCAAVVLGTLAAALVWRQPLALIADPLQLQAKLLARLDAWQAEPRGQRLSSVMVVGNSLMNCPTSSVATALEPALAARGRMDRVVATTQRALLPLHYYALLDGVLSGPPRDVVIVVDLRAFSPAFGIRGFEFPALTRRLSFRRTLAAADALHEQGLTVFDPAIYRLEDALGLVNVAAGVRAWGGDVLEGAGDALREATHIPGASARTRAVRFLPAPETEEGARKSYLVDQAASPGARVLRDIVTIARAAGRPPLLYLSPVDIDRLTELGLRDELRIDERVAALRDAIGVTPQEWLDLHAALPDARFRDANNHLDDEGCRRVADAVAQKLTGR